MSESRRKPTGNALPLGIDTEIPIPNANIGQHTLIDREVLGHIRDLVPLGARCVEIGAGPGALTSELLPRVDSLTVYEIDERYQPHLEQLGQGYDFQVHIQNFLNVPNTELNNLGDYHIVGNIPYHISEPLITKLTGLKFESTVLLVGQRMAGALTAMHPGQDAWSRMSMVSRAYFDTEMIEVVPRTAFIPVPRADGAVLRLTRKDATQDSQSDAVTQSYRALIEADAEHSSVAKALKMIIVGPKGQVEAARDSGDSASHVTDNRATRRAGRVALRDYARQYNFGEPETISSAKKPVAPETMLNIVSATVDERMLSKPISGISNQDLKKLCSAISSAINRRQASRE